MVNVLFVCLGNICRSPSAEAVVRTEAVRLGLADRIAVDSAATHDFQVGKPPDPRAIAAGRRRGFDLSPLRARRITTGDFRRFDHILAMDLDNLRDLAALCPPREQRRLALFLDWAPEAGVREVPDPYSSGPEAFEVMLDLIEIGARGLLARLGV